MSEIKPKLNLRPSVILGEKSPPTGLLINHGKPNFTISRSKKPKNDSDTVDSAKATTPTSLTLNRSMLLKRTNRNIVAKKSENDSDQTEFFQAHKKISEKIAKENSENILKTEVNNNLSASIKTDLPKELEFAKINNGHLHTEIGSNRRAYEEHIGLKTNGHFKPPLPDKPAALQNYKPLSPTRLTTVVNINTNSPKTTPISPPNHSTGVNFEPKTVVSFSKDLSSTPNNYPDTVKHVKSVEDNRTPKDTDMIDEFSKLKFEIVSNGEAIVPVIQNP